MPKSPRRYSSNGSPASPRSRTSPNRKYLQALLEHDPLSTPGAYSKLLNCSPYYKAELTAASNFLRLKLRDTIHIPLVIVRNLLPTAPDLEPKLAILRHYIRTHCLHIRRGHDHRNFWDKIDETYTQLIQEFGNDFESWHWRVYIQAVIQEDKAFALPRATATEVPLPLFTIKPLVSSGY
ncbi:hypothetical protein MVEN_00826000 [Mycena venus]|uniref:Uncharacterized protein n=1 Tax=Mycena venus TaxID=2733690 RepID=A0A8H6YGZ4_9AGAR|nr:hypothetical protein MVEN_00826000 [Mycena venus]